MANSTSKSVEDASLGEFMLTPISPTLRKRLQKYYTYGTQKQKEGDYDYAHAMFSQCVVADPANILYVESMLNNLLSKYRGKKRKTKVRASRTNFKKSLSEKNWPKVLQAGPELLGQSPWDIPTLRGMADACAALRHNDDRFKDIELRYLRAALDSNPRDIDVNRHCAESLERMGQYDQSIACWHRIDELAPKKTDAQARISKLTVLKNMRANGMLDEPKEAGASGSGIQRASEQKKPDPPTSAGDSAIRSSKPGDAESTIDQLEQAIALDPSDTERYVSLAKAYEAKNELAEAERVLRRALSVSGQSLAVNDLLESIQMRRAKQRLAAAAHQFKLTPNEDNRDLVQRLKSDLNRLELGIFAGRAQRYPDEKKYVFELAVRLKRTGKFAEAAKHFSAASDDAEIAPAALLQQGECLQQVRKYQDAMQSYAKSAQAAEGSDSPQHAEIQLLAIYRGGVLAMGLRDPDQAQKLLKSLYKRDPNFRDVATRLDRLKAMGDT